MSVFQWVAGFGRNVQDEKDPHIKQLMLENMCDLMEDAQDFSWIAAKASHSLLLCRMEEGKVKWSETEKIDRLRRAHAQKVVTRNNKNSGRDKGVPCKFYQAGTCNICFRDHQSKDCKVRQDRSKNE